MRKIKIRTYKQGFNLTMNNFQTDLVIIGAGPVGIFAVFQAGMLKIKAHVVDALDFVGGQCNALYPEKPIYDIPAYPKIDGQDLIEQLKIQASAFDPVYHLGQSVESLEKKDQLFIVKTSNGTVISAKSVIIAAGCGAFGPNRPPLDDIELYENKSVFYMVKSREAFRGKKMVIAGGGDSAIDWALSLAEVADKLYLIHRRQKFKCAPDSLDKLHKLEAEGKIELVVPYQLHSLKGNDGMLEKVLVSDLDNNIKELDADILLPFFGLSMDLGNINNWGLKLHKHAIEVNQETMETSIPGIFAIGDVAHYPSKLKLILTGFAEAASAAHAIYPMIYPDQALHFEYSTTKGIS